MTDLGLFYDERELPFYPVCQCMDITTFNSVLEHSFTAVSDFLWTYLLIAMLVGGGLYFTIRSRFVQFRMVPEMIRLLGESAVSTGKNRSRKNISSFEAFAVSVATRVGTGNLAGVATAIAVGGPGSVFWMWLIALIGGATAFVESTLAQLFKRREKDAYIGGPAYYILHGMRNRGMASLFAVLMIITFGLSYNSIQSNTICGAMNEAFGFDPLIVGLVLMATALFIVFGGIQRIAKFSSVIVPLMAVGYFILAVVVVVMNYDKIPYVMSVIIKGAFGVEQFAGGALGITLMAGIKRGLFSNEAGEGSAPNAAATATTTHPVKQGLIQALGVFTDTLLVCSCTAFIILISGLYTTPGLNGIALTQNALQSEVGSMGKYFIAIAIIFFAFSSIIGNYYYGESNIRFLTQKKWVLQVFRVLSAAVFVLFGAVASLDVVWSMGDVCMALITMCNLVALAVLGKWAFRLLNDYREQKAKGIKDPVFHSRQLPEIQDRIPCWGNDEKIEIKHK